MHAWQVDFAVWCSYKYLNAGPGAAGGAFIHQNHIHQQDLFRLGGWWGNDEGTRFNMEKGYVPKPDANGWNLSTAQVFNMVGLKASMDIFKDTSILDIRSKSIRLTGYLEYLLDKLSPPGMQIITPKDPQQRGAQLSLLFGKEGKEIHSKLANEGILADYREPGVIRVAPAPMYNSFEEVFRFYEVFLQL